MAKALALTLTAVVPSPCSIPAKKAPTSNIKARDSQVLEITNTQVQINSTEDEDLRCTIYLDGVRCTLEGTDKSLITARVLPVQRILAGAARAR